MIDFTTLQGLTIPEGVVTQITDESGRVIWAVANDKPIVLEVEKITSDTYAGETTYTGEQFILLDIYPKTNGTVNVTYGGLTKTITDTSGAAEPNAQQVFFGTFNGATDSVATPASGELVIKGDCVAFGASSYEKMKGLPYSYNGIDAVVDWGEVSYIPPRAFEECAKLTSISLPSSITSIGDYAFQGCTALTSIDIPSNVTSIGDRAFQNCTALTSVIIQNGVMSIGASVFMDCTGLTHINIPSSVVNIGVNPFQINGTNIITVDGGNLSYKVDGNCLIEIGTNKVVAGFSNSYIPSYITLIGERAFMGQDNLGSVTIPFGVTSIGARAFQNCLGIEVTMLPTTPPTLEDTNVFDGCTNNSGKYLRIYAPVGFGDVYKKASIYIEYSANIYEVS